MPRSAEPHRLARRALDAVVVLAAFVAAIGGGSWAVRRSPSADPSSSVPLPTGLPGAYRYFDPLPTPAPTRVGLSRRLTRAGIAGGFPHAVLTLFDDPNTSGPPYGIVALGAVTNSVGGPRLALASGATNGTIDLGEVIAGRPVTVPLVLANAGDAPLQISRIYDSVAALDVDIAGERVDVPGVGGRLSAGAVVPPGEEWIVTLTFDPDRVRAPGDDGPVDVGAQALYIQLFSNDAGAPRMDDADPTSGERRLRVVYALRPSNDPGRPVGADELPLAPGAARVWLDEGARWGRGGRVVDIGPIDGAAPGSAVATVRNLGTGPLRLVVGAGSAAAATLDDAAVPPGGSTQLRVTLPPVAADDPLAALGAYRHKVPIETNDPLVPVFEVEFVGRLAPPRMLPLVIDRP